MEQTDNPVAADVPLRLCVADLRSATSSTLTPQITHRVPAYSIASTTGQAGTCSVISTILQRYINDTSTIFQRYKMVEIWLKYGLSIVEMTVLDERWSGANRYGCPVLSVATSFVALKTITHLAKKFFTRQAEK